MKKKRLGFFTLLLASVLVFGGVSMVSAQEQTAEDEEMATMVLDEIVIT